MKGYIKKFGSAHSEEDEKEKMYAYWSCDLRLSNSILCLNASEKETNKYILTSSKAQIGPWEWKWVKWLCNSTLHWNGWTSYTI